MKIQLAMIIQDIREGENIENYLLILAALVVAGLSLFGVANDVIISAAILAVLSLIIYSQIKWVQLLLSRNAKFAPNLLHLSRNLSDFRAEWHKLCSEKPILSCLTGQIDESNCTQIKSDRLLRSIKQANEIQGIRAFYPSRQRVPSLESQVLLSLNFAP